MAVEYLSYTTASYDCVRCCIGHLREAIVTAEQARSITELEEALFRAKRAVTSLEDAIGIEREVQ